MTHEILHINDNGIVHARLTGVMTHADLQALEHLAKRVIDAGGNLRLLVTLEAFEGWTAESSWADDLTFQFQYANQIVRIAIVGDQRWEERAMLFVGKGFRDAEVEFFQPDSLARAKAWIHAE
jgi:hypothetical protein